MTIAVGVLLFVCTILTIYRYAFTRREWEGWVMRFSSILNFVAGLASIWGNSESMPIAIGVLLSVWTIVALVLLIYAARKSVENPNPAHGLILVVVATLFFTWVTVFMVLQFSIVV